MNLNEECLISACVHCEAFEQSRMKIIRGVDIFHLILSSLKTSRLHAGFKSCVRVSEFSVDLENSDSAAADECEWTRSRRSDRLSPRSRTQHKSNVSVPRARFTWMYSFCFCTFSIKNFDFIFNIRCQTQFTSDKPSDWSGHRGFYHLCHEDFQLFLRRISTRTRLESDSTENKWLESRLGLDGLRFDTTEEKVAWINVFIWCFQFSVKSFNVSVFKSDAEGILKKCLQWSEYFVVLIYLKASSWILGNHVGCFSLFPYMKD